MKIAHTGDAHWGLGYPGPSPESRFEDITRVMDWMADRIIEECCDLVIFAGDAFKDAKVFLDRASIEIKAFVGWLRKITEAGIPVLVISGTPSHDAISAYKLVKEMQIPKVNIFTEPGVASYDNVYFACLPGFNRSSFVAHREECKSLQPHIIHQMMTDYITDKCRELLEQCEDPAILVSHLTYDLADKGFEDVLMQHEPILTQEAIQGFDLVCLGHIHRPQQNGNVFYCGAPERLSFNEEKIKPGFWIHELGNGCQNSRFIETPARRFQTIEWNEYDVGAVIKLGMDSVINSLLVQQQAKDAVVRLYYSCEEATAKLLDRKALECAIYNCGAFYIQEIKADIQRQDRARDEEVTETLGPVEALARWACQQDIPDEDITALQSMTAELLEEVTI